MLDIDNSGDGNCMYYAYSISLMYYLRAKNNPVITDGIFNKLALSEETKSSLSKLLLIDPNKEFTQSEIKTIESILGKATRDLAAERTVEEFKVIPEDTSLFTAAQYGLEYHLKQMLQSTQPELADLIDNDFKNENFTEAEIYRTPNIKQAMSEFIKNKLSAVIATFEQEWPKKKDALELNGKTLSEKDVKFYKSQVFNNILREKTVAFFFENDNQHLNSYKNRLQQNYVWGTEDTLMILHRAIQGEGMECTIATDIVLHIYKNGESPFLQSGTPEIILNHKPGHWTSQIPETIFTHQVSTVQKKETTTTNIKEIPKTPIQEKTRENPLLQSSQFWGEIKIIEMTRALNNIPKHLEEYKAANRLFDKLEDGIGIIDPINSKSLPEKEKAVNQIIEDIIEASPKLGHYQSWGTFFKNFLSALLDWIPALLGGNKIRSGLETWGFYKADRRPEITIAIERVTNKLLDAIDTINPTVILGTEKDSDLDNLSL